MKNIGIISSYGIIDGNYTIKISLDTKVEIKKKKYNVYIDENQNILQLEVDEVFSCHKTIAEHIEMFLDKKVEFILDDVGNNIKDETNSTAEVNPTKKPSYEVSGIIYYHEQQ